MDFNSADVTAYLKKYSSLQFILDGKNEKGTKAIVTAIEVSEKEIDKRLEQYKHLLTVKSNQLFQLQQRIKRLTSYAASDSKDVIFSVYTTNNQALVAETPPDIGSIHSIINLLSGRIYSTLYDLKIQEVKLVAQISTIHNIISLLQNSKSDLSSYKSKVQSI